MHLNDTGIVLTTRPYGERDTMTRIFTHTHGTQAGMVKYAQSSKKRGIAMPGNAVQVSWQGRPGQLGRFDLELITPHAALIMQDALALSALTSACQLTDMSLAEHDPHPNLYTALHGLLPLLAEGTDWQEAYVQYELSLLSECGFGLDLTHCAATGTIEDLIYVSPKSGRAVCKTAGEPYKEKLLRLPAFLTPPPPVGGRAGVGVHTRRPNRHGSHHLIENARELRRSMSQAEKQLWYHLRDHRFDNYRFRRQHPITTDYIADFICLDKKLIIEVDGGQHAENMQYDDKRTAVMEQEGYQVLRFWNNEVLEQMEAVLGKILEALRSRIPTLTLPPTGGGESGNALPTRAGKRHFNENPKEILAGLALTGYFLEHWLLEPHGRKLPAARERLMAGIMRQQHKQLEPA